jgi:hypothetical protein
MPFYVHQGKISSSTTTMAPSVAAAMRSGL